MRLLVEKAKSFPEEPRKWAYAGGRKQKNFWGKEKGCEPLLDNLWGKKNFGARGCSPLGSGPPSAGGGKMSFGKKTKKQIRGNKKKDFWQLEMESGGEGKGEELS